MSTTAQRNGELVTGPRLSTLKENQVLPVSEMRGLLKDLTPSLLAAVPGHLKGVVDRLGSSLLTEVRRSIAAGGRVHLGMCTAYSLLGGLVQASSLGLELGGVLGQAYLVPFKNNNLNVFEAQFQVGYRGLITLARRSGQTKVFDAHPVREGDDFSLEMGTQPRVLHRPKLRGQPGELYGVYAVLETLEGGVQVEYMTAEEIDAHRVRYSKQKGEYSPWNTAFEEMARKTVLRRLGKRCPVSIEIQKASTLDEYADAGVEQGLRTLVSGGMADITEPRSARAEAIQEQIEKPTEPDRETILKRLDQACTDLDTNADGLLLRLWTRANGLTSHRPAKFAEASTEDLAKLADAAEAEAAKVNS